MCLSVLSVGLSPEVAQTKQTAVFMKQGRATRVFCLAVHFSTHTRQYAHMYTPKCPTLLIFYLPCSVAFPPLVFSAPLSPSLSRAPVLSVFLRLRGMPLCLTSHLQRGGGAGLDRRENGQLQSCARVCEETGVVNSNAHALILT